MSEQTKIEWCDSTLNWWEGCTKVSAGCANCYAAARDHRFTGGKHWGKGAPRRKSANAVKEALKLNRKPWICENGHANSGDTFCYEDGCESQLFHRRRIFSLSLGDWLDPEVPIEWLAEMLDTVRQCGQVEWLLVTKRPELWNERLHAAMRNIHNDTDVWISQWLDGIPPKNVMVLASVENQEQADKRIPELLKIAARRLGLSCEPLLGAVDLNTSDKSGPMAPVDWVIIGGESGPGARPCNVEWVRGLKEQCQAADVPCFVKQLGRNIIDATGYDIPTNDAKGGDMAEWPEDLRVREFYR